MINLGIKLLRVFVLWFIFITTCSLIPFIVWIVIKVVLMIAHKIMLIKSIINMQHYVAINKYQNSH